MDTEQNNLHINTFTEGMNADWSFDNLKNTQYRYALNLRATNTEDGGYDNPSMKSGIMSQIYMYKYTIDGSDEFTNSKSGIYVYKLITCGDYCVVIYKNSKSKLNIASVSQNANTFKFTPICSIKTEDGYDPKNISAVLHYESDKVVMLYIADGIHKIISVNIVDTDFISQLQKDGMIDINYIIQNNYFPNRKTIILGTTSGQLKTQQLQYTYRFYKKHGNCSQLAPLTNKIQIIDSNRSKVEGNAEDTTTSIGMKLRIVSEDIIPQFDYIQIYRLSYIKPNQNAEVQLIYDGELIKQNNKVNFEFIDDGKKSLQNLTLDEFSDLNGLQLIPKVIEQNQGYLFAGNVKDETIITFDQTKYDFRAFQIDFNNITNAYEWCTVVNNIISPISDQYNSVTEALTNLYNELLSDDFDYINPYTDINHKYDSKISFSSNWSNDIYPKCMCTYDNYLGGNGPMIDWYFEICKSNGEHFRIKREYNSNNNYSFEPEQIDTNTVSDYYRQNGVYIKDNVIDYNNIFSSSLYRSLKRDEVYRYGVVFFNSKGARTNVQWIADIRVPSISEVPIFDEKGNIQTIGITFNFINRDIERFYDKDDEEYCTFSKFIRDYNIIGYEIVRCDKNDQYTRNLSQVALSSLVKQPLIHKDENSPMYPTGLLTSQPQQVVYTPFTTSNYPYPGYMDFAKHVSNYFQIYNPEIQIQRKDFLSKIKNLNCKIKPCTFVYNNNEIEELKIDGDTTISNEGVEYDNIFYVRMNYYLNQRCVNIFNDRIVYSKKMGIEQNEGFYNEQFNIGDYLYINKNLIDVSRLNKINKTLVCNYNNQSNIVYLNKFFVSNSLNYINKFDTLEKNLTDFSVSNINKFNLAFHTLHNTSQYNVQKFDLSKYKEFEISNIIDVKNLNWEDGFSNIQTDGDKIKNGVKKYKSYVQSIKNEQYLNWICSSKYDIPIGTDDEYGWTKGFTQPDGKSSNYSYVKEFTSVGGDYKERVHEALGPIGPSGQSFIININYNKNIFNIGMDTTGTINNTNIVYNSPFDSILYPEQYRHNGIIPVDADENTWVNCGDPTKLIGCPIGTILCNITHTATQFAGLTPEEMKYDTYYGFGNYFNINKSGNSATCTVFDGDIYINMNEFVSMFKAYDFNDDKSSLQSLQIVNYIPMESKINQMFDYGMNYRNTQNPNLQLEPGTIKGISSQDRPLNQYNLIYSDNNTSNNIYNVDNDKNVENTYKQRVFYSQLKTNGENIDNWQIFKAANFIDVNTYYGDITDLYTVRDTLYFWQKYAFGKLSVNERSLVKDENSNQIQLGQGGILQRSDYISTKFGMYPDDMCKIEAQGVIYWFDFYNRCIVAFDGQQTIDYSESKNIKTYLKNNYDYKTHPMPSLAYDQQHQELLFSPMMYVSNMQENNTDKPNLNSVLSFNVKYRIANAFYSYMNNNNDFGNKLHQYKQDVLYFSAVDPNSETDTTTNIYTFGLGDNKYHIGNSQIAFVVNKAPSTTKVFDNQQLVPAKCWDQLGKNIDTGEGFFAYNHFKFRTDLNESKSTNADEATNREGNVCYSIPRYGDEYGQRLRGKWMTEELTHTQNAPDFSISHIITKFRQSYN